MHTGQFHVHNTQFATKKTLPNRLSYQDMHNLGNESLILARSHDTLPQWLTKMEPRLALCTTTLGNPWKLLDYLRKSSIVFRSCQNLLGTVQKSSEFFRNWGYMDMKITCMWISKTTLGVVKFYLLLFTSGPSPSLQSLDSPCDKSHPRAANYLKWSKLQSSRVFTQNCASMRFLLQAMPTRYVNAKKNSDCWFSLQHLLILLTSPPS